MDLAILLVIALANFFIVSIFTMSGGIGLVARPMMIFLGVPAPITIGTSRVSAIPGNVMAQVILHKSKKIDWRLVRIMVLPNIIGGLTGIYVIVSLSENVLKRVIGVALLLGGVALLINKKRGLKKMPPLLGRNHWLVSMPVIFVIGSLLVLVGGAGPFARILYIFGYGKTHIEAAATQKAINFWQSIITAIIFIALSLIDWSLLLVLMVSSFLGNFVGTKFVLKKGERYLRTLLLVVIFVSAVKLIFFP